jgi:PhzF family phenazine biosynthesis protein
MQDLARKFGQEVAFLLSPRSSASDLRIRYFVPDHEMGVSGHATIAAIAVALGNRMVRTERIRVETITGPFAVSWTRPASDYVVTLEQNSPVFGSTAAAEPVARVLNIQADEIAAVPGPIQSVSVSRPKLLVPLKDARVLDRLAPDFPALWDLCDRLQVSGLYPFTQPGLRQNVSAEARQFPLRAGFPEDPATGVAAAALGAYLARYDLGAGAGRHEFRIAQGYAMGAPSLIEAIADCADGKVTRTAIRGSARVTGREPLTL